MGGTLATLHGQGMLTRLSIGVDNRDDAERIVARSRRPSRAGFKIN